MDESRIKQLSLEGERLQAFKASYAADMQQLDEFTDITTGEGVDTIKVCVRIRPPNPLDDSDICAWQWDRQTVNMVRPSRRSSFHMDSGDMTSAPYDMTMPSFTFDYLFHPEDDNSQIYNDLGKTIVAKALEGYHGCIFTYGQTASGKTFTMNGTARSPGLIPHASFDIFEMIEATPDRAFSVRLAYLELYREQVLDLLNPDVTASERIKIQFDPKVGTVITGLTEESVSSPQQIMVLLQRGEALRHVGATDMNEKSSRAHTIFRLLIESKSRDPTDLVTRKSTLNLIDLAGSENARMTNAIGDRAKEAKFINQSLLTLSTIIQRLGEVRSGGGHLPFRDSKLTRILQDPLSGNSVIAIICTISTSLKCADETTNTLKFAARAKKITLSRAMINEHMDDKSLIRHYENEISSLKNMVSELMSRLQHGAAANSIGPIIKSSVSKLIESMERYMEKAKASLGDNGNVIDELKMHEVEVQTMLKDIKEKIEST